MQNYQHRLDVRHLRCPMPLIRVRQYLSTMQYQERLLVLTADVATRKDLPSMLHQLKQPLVEQGQHLSSDWFVIEKGQSPC